MLPDFRVRQRDYLLEISRALTQELDLDKLLERILNISIEMLAGQAGLIALRSETQGWQIRVSTGLPPAFQEYLEQQFTQSTDLQSPSENEGSGHQPHPLCLYPGGDPGTPEQCGFTLEYCGP